MILCSWHEKWCHPAALLLLVLLHLMEAVAWAFTHSDDSKDIDFADRIVIFFRFRQCRWRRRKTPPPRLLLRHHRIHAMFNGILRYIMLGLWAELSYLFPNEDALPLARMKIERQSVPWKGYRLNLALPLLLRREINIYRRRKSMLKRLETSSLIAHHSSRSISVGERWKASEWNQTTPKKTKNARLNKAYQHKIVFYISMQGGKSLKRSEKCFCCEPATSEVLHCSAIREA